MHANYAVTVWIVGIHYYIIAISECHANNNKNHSLSTQTRVNINLKAPSMLG